MSLHDALGSLRDCGQWFVYRLSQWSDERKKYVGKEPWHHIGNHRIAHNKPENWISYEAARASLAARPTHADGVYALGLWLTKELNVFLFDLDGFAAASTPSEADHAAILRFPGALVEWSSSTYGAHVIARHDGSIGKHECDHGKWELYTHSRGIAFGLTGEAVGSADVDCTDSLKAMIAEYFSKGATGSVSGAVVAGGDLHGRIALNREVDKVVTAKAGERNKVLNDASFLLGGYVGAGRLEEADVHDALVNAVVKASWDDIPKCIRTISGGIEAGKQEPLVATTFAVAQQVPDANNGRDFLDMVAACGSVDEMYTVIIPTLQVNDLGIYREQLVTDITKKLELLGAKTRVPTIRGMLIPKIVANGTSEEAPAWAQAYCYVAAARCFYNIETGGEYDKFSFYAKHALQMPLKPNGRREDPAEWAFEKWGMVTVDNYMYHPQRPAYFEWAGRDYVNKFTPSSIPLPTPFTERGVKAIGMFQSHMLSMCGGRVEVYMHLLNWMAHNVQFPGKKIRWSPIIKGVQGDGKSIIGDVMRAALGDRNVDVTGTNTLKNNGGFTDWALGKAVNFIEEMRLVGQARYDLFEAMKNFIDLAIININPKGDKSFTVPNVTNHVANTNYNDGLPIDAGDRRWMVIISPYSSIDEAIRDKGLADGSALVAYFKEIGQACRELSGEWRAWLMSIDLSNFDADGRAPWTDDKGRMIATSKDDTEDMIQQILERGGRGISEEVFSSNRLTGLLRTQVENFDVPKGHSLHHIFVRMGYEKFPKVLRWDGTTHRVWTKSRYKADEISVRAELDKTITANSLTNQ